MNPLSGRHLSSVRPILLLHPYLSTGEVAEGDDVVLTDVMTVSVVRQPRSGGNGKGRSWSTRATPGEELIDVEGELLVGVGPLGNS